MKIVLSGIELDKDEESGEGRSVKNIVTEDTRNVEAYDSPGTQGSSYSDQGRSAVKVSLEGTATGKEAYTLLEGIWSSFKKGDPVEFSSDVSSAADITKALISSFIVTTAAGNRNRFDYTLELWEYKEPPEEPTAPGEDEEGEAEEAAGEESVNAGEQAEVEASEWADEEAERAEATRNQITGVVYDESGQPAKDIDVTIAGEGREIKVKTDDQGVYKAMDLEVGDYTITVDAPGYEGMEEKVSVN